MLTIYKREDFLCFPKLKSLMWQGGAHYLHLKYGESSGADVFYFQPNWCILGAKKKKNLFVQFSKKKEVLLFTQKFLRCNIFLQQWTERNTFQLICHLLM